mgnify:CR=1 FL=1
MKYAYKIGAAVLAVVVVLIAVFTPLICIGIESFAASTLVSISDARGYEEAKEIIEKGGAVMSEYAPKNISRKAPLESLPSALRNRGFLSHKGLQ